MDRALNRFGLTHAHYLVLGSLSEFSRGGAKPSQRELADFAGLEVMYVSKLVRALEHSGLLRRADHPDDPRAFQLELTARGVDQVERAAAVMRQLFDQLLRPIGGRTGKRNVALVQTSIGSRCVCAACQCVSANLRLDVAARPLPAVITVAALAYALSWDTTPAVFVLQIIAPWSLLL